MSDRYPLEGWVALKADDHRPEQPERGGIGCTCGFCVWSPEHVAIMAYREAVDAAPRVPTVPEPRCRSGNELKLHTGPCSPICEYPKWWS